MNSTIARSLLLAGTFLLPVPSAGAVENSTAVADTTAFSRNISLSGLIEVEGSYIDPEGAPGASDINLATFELGIEARLSQALSAHATLLYEEDGDDELLVDEAYIRMKPADTPFFVEAGRFTQPFGNFATGMVSDPVTLELAETKHNASVKGGYESGIASASVTAFKSDISKDGDEAINTWVAAVAVSDEIEDSFSYQVGGSWISNIAATDGLKGDYEAEDSVTTYFVGGYGFYAVVGFGPVELNAEYLAAADEFRDGARAGQRPSAWNVEAGYIVSEPLGLSVRYGGAEDFGIESQYGAAVALKVMEHASLALEYLHEKNRVNDEGVARDRDAFTVQLAMEF